MANLFGAQRLVLQAIRDLPKDAAGFVTDAQVAQRTRIALNDVRDWIETLEGEGYVEVARTTEGLRAAITAKGRLQLGLFSPTQSPEGRPIDPKDRRVAIQFRKALTPLYFVLHPFSEECGVVDDLVALCAEKKPNSTLHPQDSRAIEAILSALSKTSPNGPSVSSVDGQRISWADALIKELIRLGDECDGLVDRFVDRDESMISAMEQMAQQGRILRPLLDASIAYPLSESFKTGVPPTHINFFRSFLLALRRSFRVIGQFDPRD